MIYTVTLNPAIDYVMHPLTLDMGFTNRSSSEEIHCGGNGINVSTLLNELGVSNVAFGIAAGFTGDYLISRLQEKGVTCSFVKLDKGFTRINVKLNGIVMTIVNGMGPRIPEKKVDELLERLDGIKPGDTLVLTGSIPSSLPENMYDIIMRRMAGRGIRFVVDAPGSLLMESLSAHPFMIKPNNHEVGRIFGANPETP
ncbi:MAG: PfkB family carbohydrate kinase, partial [Coriobacteriales bacterium]|nr:PfkB family carbohydrate kinase [Coriobacteriales bacterium]